MAKKTGKKKLEVKKQTVQELDEDQLDQVAGGVNTGTCAALTKANLGINQFGALTPANQLTPPPPGVVALTKGNVARGLTKG